MKNDRLIFYQLRLINFLVENPDVFAIEKDLDRVFLHRDENNVISFVSNEIIKKYLGFSPNFSLGDLFRRGYLVSKIGEEKSFEYTTDNKYVELDMSMARLIWFPLEKMKEDWNSFLKDEYNQLLISRNSKGYDCRKILIGFKHEYNPVISSENKEKWSANIPMPIKPLRIMVPHMFTYPLEVYPTRYFIDSMEGEHLNKQIGVPNNIHIFHSYMSGIYVKKENIILDYATEDDVIKIMDNLQKKISDYNQNCNNLIKSISNAVFKNNEKTSDLERKYDASISKLRKK